jgi:hypothetical protein
MNGYEIVNEALFGNYDDEIKVSFKVKGDGKIDILKILKFCEHHGMTGHSFDIVLDPDSNDYKMTVSWDGDGADSISDLKVNGKKIPKEFDKKHMEKE